MEHGDDDDDDVTVELQKHLPWTFPHMCLCLEGRLRGPISRQTRGRSVSQGINHFRGSLGLLQTVPFSLFGVGCVISLNCSR